MQNTSAIRGTALSVLGAILIATSSMAGESMDKFKTYKYEGHEFQVFEPKDGRSEVTGLGLTGTLTVHNATGVYRESLHGWGSDLQDLSSALDRLCARIIERAQKPSEEELAKGLEDFYEQLK